MWRLIAGVGVVAACGGGDSSPVQHDSGASTDSASADTSADSQPPDALLPVPTYQQTELYFKASNTGASDRFGMHVALSSDGKTMAVAAPNEASNATGIDGDQNDNSTVGTGAVYVFALTGSTWSQQAYVKSSNVIGARTFGAAVALSADGNTMAVGANAERSCATGVNGDQTNTGCGGAGAVYVFTRASDGSWSQQAYVKASNTTYATPGFFGDAVALSGDGTTLVVGAPLESSAGFGVNGTQTSNTSTDSGAAYVFTRTGTSWSQQAYVKASNANQNDMFGGRVALSWTGDVMAISATNERSNAVGVNGSQTDDSLVEAGAVYVFERSNGAWSQKAYIKASNTDQFDSFGFGLALSGSGKTLAVGAFGESSAATGIGGDQTDNSQLNAGAVYVFFNSGTWAQQAYVKGATSRNGDEFGYSIALSIDGNTLAASALEDDSSGTGFTTPQTTLSNDTGAAYLFHRTGATWSQLHYIKASNANSGDLFGSSISLSADASILAVGAYREQSAATGVGGDQTDNTLTEAGATYLIQ